MLVKQKHPTTPEKGSPQRIWTSTCRSIKTAVKRRAARGWRATGVKVVATKEAADARELVQRLKERDTGVRPCVTCGREANKHSVHSGRFLHVNKSRFCPPGAHFTVTKQHWRASNKQLNKQNYSGNREQKDNYTDGYYFLHPVVFSIALILILSVWLSGLL